MRLKVKDGIWQMDELELEFLPRTLWKLLDFEITLIEQGTSLDEGLGLRFADKSMAYDLTPYDVLPFADIGMDGIHYGLLADFGKVTDLEQAFVVCVNPVDPDNSVKLVARNPKEFIDLLYTVKDAAVIANSTYFEEEEQYVDAFRELKEDEEEYPEMMEQRRDVSEKMKDYMDCSAIEDVYSYVEKTVADARAAMILLPTRDGLGIPAANKTGGDFPLYPVPENAEISVEEARSFFASAPVESKFAFIRDVQHAGLINNETELKGFIAGELEKMGCGAEVERLKSLDW